MKNKVIGFMLATALLLSVTGCGKQTAPVQDVVEEADEETTVEETAEDAATEADSEEENEVPFTTGIVNENIYENDYFDMKLVVPSEYLFCDEDGARELTESIADTLKDNDTIIKAIEEGDAAVVASAGKAGDFDNICVIVYSAEEIADENFDDKAALSACVELFKEYFEAQGAIMMDTQCSRCNAGDENRYVFELDGMINGSEFKEEVVGFRKDDHLIAFAATCDDLAAADDLLSGIEKN